MQFLPHNVHSNTLHPNCNTTLHLLCCTFHIIFTVTHSIQAAIPLSTCCEVSSNERTLNLCPYHIQHSTLALSTINRTAAHNIYCSNTQHAVPKTNPKASVPTKPCLYLKSYARCILFTYLQCTGWSEEFCINIPYQYPENDATFVLWIFIEYRRKLYGCSDVNFPSSCEFFACATYMVLSQYREKRLLASVCLSALNNSLHTGKMFMKYDALGFF